MKRPDQPGCFRRLRNHATLVTMLRLFAIVIGALIAAFGVVGSISPVPFGFVFIIIGLAIMLTAMPGLRARVRRWRAANPGLDRRMRTVERWMPNWIDGGLERTRPDATSDGESDGAGGEDGTNTSDDEAQKSKSSA